MAIKATLRTPNKDAATAVKAVQTVQTIVQQQPVKDTGVVVQSTTTIAGPIGDTGSQGVAGVPAAAEQFDGALYGEETVPGAAAPTPTATTTAVATRTETAVGKSLVSGDEGEFDGEFDQSDLKFPSLMIVQGNSGPLAEKFAQGDLIFGEDLLFPGPRPDAKSPALRVIPVSIAKSYRECLTKEQMDDNQMARLFRTKAEVAAAGLSLNWFQNPDPCARPSARIIFLVEAPEKTEHPGFGLELDGKAFALGVYYAKTGAYNSTAKVIWNTYKTILFVPVVDAEGKQVVDAKSGRPLKRNCIYRNVWNWTWGQVQAGQFKPWRPDMKLSQTQTGPDVRAFCADLLQGRAEAAGESE